MKYIYSLCFFGMVLFFVGGNLIDISGTFRLGEAPFFIQVISMWALFGSVILWIGMLTDFFKSTGGGHRVLWGFILVFGVFIGASIYFIVVYFRREMKWIISRGHPN